MKGYNGKIARINLSSRQVTFETPPESFYRQYLGGRGIIIHTLLKEVPPEIDPFAPENKLVFALGPISGHPLVGSNPSLSDVLRYPLVQVGRFPPRALTQLLDAQASSIRARSVNRIPAIECPTVTLATEVVAESDAVMLASLATVKGPLTSGRVVPLLREPWMVTNWALMKLRRRSISPSASAFVAGLRAAQAQCAADEESLEKKGNARPAQRSVARNPASRGR